MHYRICQKQNYRLKIFKYGISMFAVIYREFIKPGREDEYQKLWHKIADYFFKI
jgi:hypothetical protein